MVTQAGTSLSACCQWTHFIFFSFCFSSYYIITSFCLFWVFFPRGGWLSSISTEPPSVIPLWGLGNSQNTQPWLMRFVFARKKQSLTPKLCLCLCCRTQCTYSIMGQGISLLWSMSSSMNMFRIKMRSFNFNLCRNKNCSFIQFKDSESSQESN